ncbi:MAG: PAS domain-containing protein [Pararhodobacter sp.]|nr:PAS domain-containing protein [Pararhodobacter sp.]
MQEGRITDSVPIDPAPLPDTATPPLDGVIEALPEPVLVVGTDRRIALSNQAARDLFGAGIDGSQVLSCIRQPESSAALQAGFLALSDPAAPAGPFLARKITSRGGGESVWALQVAALPATNLTGDHTDAGWLVVSLRDISHIEEAEQQRRDFVANVSHEMRSPLTVLAGFVETLRGPAREDPVARDRFLEIMEREAQRMSRLVADLLSLSKVESDEKVRPRAPVSVSEVLTATLAALRPQIEAAGVAVTLDVAAAESPVPGDRDQLVQVFHNLVENALKYGASGGHIEIVTARLDSAPGVAGPVLRVTVTDDGEGIDPIHIPRLTERFYRIDGHRSREMGGTGLGLAIVKHIVNRHRGRLSIRSARGEGASFVVLLPCG